MNERLLSIVKSSWFPAASIGVVSFAVGMGVGYMIGDRKVTVYEPSDRDDEDRVYFNASVTDLSDSTDDRKDKQEIMDRLFKERQANRPDPATIVVDPPETEDDEVMTGVVTRLGFGSSTDDWDYEKELASRPEDGPYIIHVDEFVANESGYRQTTLTYYDADDIMTDSDDVPIYRHQDTVGELRFGHGSGDPNVVFVRNPKYRAEYEILYDPGAYASAVLGLHAEDEMESDELKHAHGLRKFRQDD